MASIYLYIFKKLEIVREVRNSGNVYGNPENHNLQSNQIQAWRNMEQKSFKKRSEKTRSEHREISTLYPHFKKLVYAWFLNQHKVGFSVSITDLITKVLQIEPNFKDRCYKHEHW